MFFLLSSSYTQSFHRFSLSLQTLTLSLSRPHSHHLLSSMSIKLSSHVFAGNPIRSKTPKPSEPISPFSALQTLKSHLLGHTHDPSSPDFKVLPFRKGRPLAGSIGDSTPNWHLGWLSLNDCKVFLDNSDVNLTENSLVYLGSKSEESVVYWAIDVSDTGDLVDKFGSRQLCFVELRTLMVATDWASELAMADLAVAGHVSDN